MNFKIVSLLPLLVGAMGACVANVEPGSSAGPAPDDASAGPDVAGYETSVAEAQSAVTAYRAKMGSPNVTDSASCKVAASEYDGHMRSIVSSLASGAGPMDTWMGAHQGSDGADMSCVAAMMMAELDHHHQIACTSPDLAANRAEAMRHTEGMWYYAGHMWQRCQGIAGATTASGMHSGPMMSGCAGWHEGGANPGWWGGGSCNGGMMGYCEGGWMGSCSDGVMGCCDGSWMNCHGGGTTGCYGGMMGCCDGGMMSCP